jgi:HEAT repeat protein
MTTALLVVFFAWLGLSTWVVVDRIAYDRILAGLRRGSRGHRLRWRIVGRIAADSSSDPELSAALTRYMLETDERRVVAAALDPGGGWRSVEAVRILAQAHHPRTLPALERMLVHGDGDVRAAALTVLGEMEDERATALLIDALRKGICPARWASALLDRRVIRKSSLLPLIGEPSPEVRAVATRLLARVDGSNAEIDDVLLRLCADCEADVRAAACRALGERQGSHASEQLVSMLDDPVWFVQVRAARALGQLQDLSSTDRLARLLASRVWWVRQAAKDALVDLGPAVKDQLLPWLDYPDAFARNSCAEVLQNLGVVDDLTAEAKGSDTTRALAAASLLRKIVQAGGSRVAGAVFDGPESVAGDALGQDQVTEHKATRARAA